MTWLYMGLGPRSSYINSPIRRKRLKNIYRPESFPTQWKYFWFNIHVLIFKQICCNGMIFGFSLKVNKPRAITLRVYSTHRFENEGFCKRNILINSDILLVIAASHLFELSRATGFADNIQILNWRPQSLELNADQRANLYEGRSSSK